MCQCYLDINAHNWLEISFCDTAYSNKSQMSELQYCSFSFTFCAFECFFIFDAFGVALHFTK